MIDLPSFSRLCITAVSLLMTGSVVASQISRQPAEVPQYYNAPLPSSAAQMRAWSDGDPTFPPVGHVLDKITRGDVLWLKRWREAAARVPSRDVNNWVQQWQRDLLFTTKTPEFCSFARASMERADLALKLAVSRSFASDCATAVDAKLLEAEGVPPIALVDFYASQTEAGLPPVFMPRLEQAVRSVINGSKGYEQRYAAFTLANLQQSAATQALLRIHKQIADQRLADEVAMALMRTDDAEALALANEACQRRTRDPICDSEQKQYYDGQSEQPPPVDTQFVKERITALAAAGFDRVGQLNPAQQSSADAEWLLTEAGYIHSFDVETGMFPNQHDSLLRDLATRLSPDLDDVFFEETYPPQDNGQYRLLAYADGFLYQCEAANYGDWYDVEAVLSLLNRLVEDRGLTQRFVVLYSTDQIASVAVAPRSALQFAFDQRWIVPGQAQQAMESGKAFEAEVLRDLQR